MHNCVPETPSPDPPQSRDQDRFVTLLDPTEWIEEYRPGGHHPVHLGDKFDNGTYKILRKLGYGAYSTVWLARDAKNSRYVALKILKASAPDCELRVLSHLSNSDHLHEGVNHVLKTLNHFYHIGPNGKHLCLVTEVMGPNISDLVMGPRRRLDDLARYPKHIVQQITRQLLLGLAYIHSKRIVHGDVYPGNVAFALPSLDNCSQEEVLADVSLPLTSTTVRRRDGLCPKGGDPWAPKYLVHPQPFQGTKKPIRVDLKYFVVTEKPIRVDLKNFVVKFIDFGTAFELGQARRPGTPKPFRAPELIVGNPPFSEKIDIWSLGMMVFSLLTDNELMQLDFWIDDTVALDDDHLLQLHSVLGPLPPSVTKYWSRHSLYFDSQGCQRRNTAINAGYSCEFVEFKNMKERLMESRPEGMSVEEALMCLDMLEHMLAIEPENRSGAAELLRHPWLNELD
ncbi:kinase-like domain-containing protein [Kalaharituber pfeilii]|nr:kinase-like domain-containing protein [Kalaharituber pfeilii]